MQVAGFRIDVQKTRENFACGLCVLHRIYRREAVERFPIFCEFAKPDNGPVVHRHILGFRLGPASSPEHVLGWQIVTRESDAITLETSGPLMRGVLVARRTPAAAALNTFVYYRRPSTRVIWTCISPLHRAVAPYLMNRAASAR